MPYNNNADLPDSVTKHLPKHAQDIYREAFNSAYKEYEDKGKRQDQSETREEVAHKVAWAAVKNEYKKDETGEWKRKSS